MGFLGDALDTVTGGLFSGVKNAIGYGVSSLFGQNPDQQRQKQVQSQKDLMNYQNDIWQNQNDILNKQNRENQSWLLENGAALQAQGARNAGFNPALMDGASPQAIGGSNSVGSGAAITPGQGFGVESLSQLAQASVYREQAEGLRIENERKREEDKWYRKAVTEFTDKFNEIFGINKYFDDADHTLDDVITTAKAHKITFNKGSWDARKETETMFNSTMFDWLAKRHVTDAEISKADWENLVNSHKFKSPDILQAMLELPIQEVNKVKKEISKMQSEIELNGSKKDLTDVQKELGDLEKKIKENTNIGVYLDKIKSGNMEFSDWMSMIFLIILSQTPGFK